MGKGSSPHVVRTGAVVETAHGAVQGTAVDGVHEFLGIPYAAPPFGVRRLRPPQPVHGWSGVRDATRLGPEPPQVAPPSTGGPENGAREDWGDVAGAFAAVERAAASKECLNLNVWTPDPGAGGLPVMVWIQGGMFELSSTAAYDGSRFARDGSSASSSPGVPVQKGSSTSVTASRTWGSSTRWLPWSGYGRTSPASAETLPT